MTRIFLDTNFVLDFIGERQDFYLPAAQLMTLADYKKIHIYTSATTIATSFYILSKFESKKTALKKIRKFKMLCSLSIINDEVIEKAINSDFNDFEDAIQYYSALASKCELIITRNEKDFKKAIIPVMSAFEFMKVWEE